VGIDPETDRAFNAERSLWQWRSKRTSDWARPLSAQLGCRCQHTEWGLSGQRAEPEPFSAGAADLIRLPVVEHHL
jgi:hypothetical protein